MPGIISQDRYQSGAKQAATSLRTCFQSLAGHWRPPPALGFSKHPRAAAGIMTSSWTPSFTPAGGKWPGGSPSWTRVSPPLSLSHSKPCCFFSYTSHIGIVSVPGGCLPAGALSPDPVCSTVSHLMVGSSTSALSSPHAINGFGDLTHWRLSKSILAAPLYPLSVKGCFQLVSATKAAPIGKYQFCSLMFRLTTTRRFFQLSMNLVMCSNV